METLPLIALACGTQLYLQQAFLARKGSYIGLPSLEALSFQTEKDELIAELEQAKASSASGPPPRRGGKSPPNPVSSPR